VGKSFAQIAFTPLVKKQQVLHGSRSQYERVEQSSRAGDALTEPEREFILSRDSFYMATVSETGWPYIQHRGGEPGFLDVLDDRTIAFADYRGNRQYVSIGNLEHDERVALFLMDYPSRSRLKILGRAEVREGADAQKLIGELSGPDVRALVERAIVIRIEAFDWNCQQYITPRFTEEQVIKVMTPMRQRLAELEEENKRLRAELAQQR
jgi:Predicted flavin-nucleotide-binding protein structurally related to pyridoxine 5''-phosphate oxidase